MGHHHVWQAARTDEDLRGVVELGGHAGFELRVYGAWLGRFGSMDSARFTAEAALVERVHWERRHHGARSEAWSHRD